MAKLIKPSDCPKCMPGWLATFGDLMSLLLCFFVLLLSMATMDAKKFENAIGSLAGALSVLEGGSRPQVQKEQEMSLETSTRETRAKLKSENEIMKTASAINQLLTASGSPEVSVEEAEDGFILRLPASLLFSKGKAQIENDDARLFLKRISMVIAKLPSEVNTNIIGHTDDQKPDIDSIYKDNWQLSSARAITVAQELINNGVDAKKLIASARASYNPFASNDSEQGRAKNNRVEIHFVSLDKKEKERTKKSILDAGQ